MENPIQTIIRQGTKIFQLDEHGHLLQWSMTLTDMKLTEYTGLTEKSAMTELFI